MHSRTLILLLLGLVAWPAWGQRAPYVAFEHVGPGKVGYNVQDIARDRYGMMWLATNEGVVRYDGYGFKHLRRKPGDPNSLLHHDVNGLLEDRQGFLWLGTDGGGLTRYDPASGRFTHYKPDPERPAETLSNALVSVLHEDHAGTLWIGTHGGGLNRLDPATERFTHYRPDTAASGLGHGGVRALHETADGVLWVGTEAGWLHRFDPQTETFTRYRVGAEQTAVRAILGDAATLWLAVNGPGDTAGLYTFDVHAARAQRFTPSTEADFRSATALARDAQGFLWIGTAEEGLYSFDPRTGALVHYAPDLDDPHSLSDKHIRVLHATPDGLLWIGTNLGGLDLLNLRQRALGRYKLDTAAFDRREQEMGVYALHESQDGTRWLGTLGGLLRIDAGTGRVTRYAADEGPPRARLPHSTVSAIHEDEDGMLWLGTDEGLVRFDPRAEAATAYSRPQAPAFEQTQAILFDIHQDAAGLLWMTTNGGGLLRFDPVTERFATYTFAEGTDNRRNFLIGIAESEEALWLGSMGGLLRFDPATEAWDAYGDKHDALHEIILALYHDADGMLWLGTPDGGLIKFDPKTEAIRRYTEAEGLAGNTVSALAQDERGRFWITSGQDGLAYFDPQTEAVVHFGPGDGALAYFNQNAVFKTPRSLLMGGVGGYNEVSLAASLPVASPTILLETQTGLRLEAGSRLRLDRPGEALPMRIMVLDYADPAENHCYYRLQQVHASWIACNQGLGTFTSLGDLAGEYVLDVRGVNSNGMETEATFTVVVPVPWWRTGWVQGFGGLALLGLVALGVYAVQQRKLRYQAQQQAALEEARQKERDQLASWVHDGPLADLVGLRFDLEELDHEPLTSDGEESMEHIKDTLIEVRTALRNVCGELQLPSFKYGLSTAIRSHVNRFKKMHPGLAIRLELALNGQRLPEAVRPHLFLIYNTAMNNIVRHAEATEVVVRLFGQDNQAVLEIEDNGQGFTPPKQLMNLRTTQQYGLLLAERHAQTIGGQLDIRSAVGAGTCVRVAVKR